mmetsp:Transcript_11620/g.34606  ORF Transcript_11620/g.34606 Transcript_11620/m.34606 type:complete len:131 (-) Transcript_11620:51-443(-)
MICVSDEADLAAFKEAMSYESGADLNAGEVGIQRSWIALKYQRIEGATGWKWPDTFGDCRPSDSWTASNWEDSTRGDCAWLGWYTPLKWRSIDCNLKLPCHCQDRWVTNDGGPPVVPPQHQQDGDAIAIG